MIRDLEEENEIFSEYSTVSKRPSPKQVSGYSETAKTKDFLSCNQKASSAFFSLCTFFLLSIVVTPA